MPASTLDREAARTNALDVLRSHIPTRRTTVYTLTDYTRGMTDYVRVFVVRKGAISELTYYIAAATGHRMTDRGLPFGGGQYSKALEAADLAWRARFGEPLDQSVWREL